MCFETFHFSTEKAFLLMSYLIVVIDKGNN